MKARPRKHVLASGWVAVLRLVHVPEGDKVNAIHSAGTSGRLEGAVLEWRSAAMRILDRYVYREVFSHTMLGLVVFTFVFFVPQLVRLMELVVRHSTGASNVSLLFLCSLPAILTFTLPMAALVGTLIGLGRLSADSEIVAMNAAGIGLRRLLVPIGLLALGAGLLTLLNTVWLGPVALRTLHVLEHRLSASQASFAVQPRVFDERFPHLVLYVQDVDATATRWRGVFLAESDAAAGLRLTLAEDAIVVAERGQGKLELHLGNGSTHEYDARDPSHYDLTAFGASDESVALSDSSKPKEIQLTDAELSMRQLLTIRGKGWRDAQVELHRRLAFPVACLVFALLGVPVGVRPRRGGRAAGFVVTLLLISGYYLIFVTGVHMAQQGTISPAAGIWAANLFTLVAALVLLRRIERVRGKDALVRWIDALISRFRKPQPAPSPARGQNGPVPVRRLGVRLAGRPMGFPLLIDLYVLRTFLSFFVLVLVGFIVLFDAFTLFDLLEDISRHNIPFFTVINYFRFLSPMMVYQLVPLAALVAMLVTLGVMAKNNEITALKASGISVYRLAVPLLVSSAVLAIGLFLLDDTFLPYANQRQDALRNQIKGRPAQTYFQPAHQWIFGENEKVYNYELFDSDQNLFGGLSVFELDPDSFQMLRRVFASRAQWVPSLNTWVLESGWVRDFKGGRVVRYIPFRVSSLEELSEPPTYFKREVRQSYQMNWRQLGQYIRDLRQAGFDTARLSVQWQKKFAFPLIAPIIVFLGIPFAFLVGTRGAVGGLALAVGIGIAYWATAALFEAMGGVGQLPPLLAGWAPDAIFGFVGLYFFLKMPT